MSRNAGPARASTSIPYLPRLLLTSIEPVFALGGVLQLLTNPHFYTATLSRSETSSIHPAAQGTSWIYTQLAGGWLLVAYLEAVALRLNDDVRVWRIVCAGILLSDLCYCWGAAQASGGWAEHVKVTEWTGLEWLAAVTTWPFVLVRLGIVGGLWGEGKVKRV
jgi:hypothetical protein